MHDPIIQMAIDTSEDMQPNEEVSRKIVNWIEKLGLDQVRRIVQKSTFSLQISYLI